MTRDLWGEGGTARDYDAPVNHETMGDGWDLNAPAGYTAGAYRYDSWAGGGDVRAYLESATNVRIRDISLSYQAPDGWLQSLGARSLRLTVQARNPLVFSHYWSFDPEFNNFGATNLNRFVDLRRSHPTASSSRPWTWGGEPCDPTSLHLSPLSPRGAGPCEPLLPVSWPQPPSPSLAATSTLRIPINQRWRAP